MGRVRLLVIFVSLVCAFAGTAHAFPQDHIAAARDALVAGDRKMARDALALADDAFPTAEGVTPNDVLASYWYFRGLLALQQGRTKRAMEEFRQSLIVDNDFQWDKSLNEQRDARKLFEALRNEVKSRDVHSPKVPEKMGFAQAYVDGTRVRSRDWVAIGRRLAQVQCPEGDVYGLWTNFKDPVDWLALCPYEVDTSVDIYAVTGETPDDEFGGVAVMFDDEIAPTGDEVAPTVDEIAPTDDEVTPTDDEVTPTSDEVAPTDDAPESSPPAHQESPSETDERRVSDADPPATDFTFLSPRNITIGVGGGMMLGGVTMHFAVVKPSFAMVEWGRRNSDQLTRSQADTLTRRFVTRRFWTWTVFGVGAGVTAAGVLLVEPTNLQPTLVVFPGGIGLQGRFH